MTIEYRIKAVTRYVLTRHTDGEHGRPTNDTEDHRESVPETRQIGPEYTSAETVYEVGYALARQDAERLGYGPGDDRVIYPEQPTAIDAVPTHMPPAYAPPAPRIEAHGWIQDAIGRQRNPRFV